MTDLNFIILTIYLLCVSLVFNQIIESFNDEFSISIDQDKLNADLAAHGLQDWLGISFKFEKRYEFDQLKQLDISITNKSSDHPIYIDWDYCSMTDLDDKARRIARLPPGTTLDLFQPQVFSAITPGTTLKEKITAEDLLKRKGDNSFMEISGVLIDLKAPGPKAPDKAKKRHKNFMECKEELYFSVNLVFRIIHSSQDAGSYRGPVQCRFTISKLHWWAGLPWNPKK